MLLVFFHFKASNYWLACQRRVTRDRARDTVREERERGRGREGEESDER